MTGTSDLAVPCANEWRCPNDPPCPHSSLVHDIYALDDPSPRCCVTGCDCGTVTVAAQDTPPTTEETR